MQRLGGKEVADKIVEEIKVKVEELKGKGIDPKLAILRVGAREDDLAYERGVLKRFESAGVEVEVTALDADISQEELDKTFDGINNDPKVHGILVFRPLPKGLSDEHMRRTIDPGKDSDFMDLRNMENVLAGVPDCAAPCYGIDQALPDRDEGQEGYSSRQKPCYWKARSAPSYNSQCNGYRLPYKDC